MKRTLIFVLVGMILLFLNYFGGAIEGKLFPVTRDTRVTALAPDGPGRSLIWGQSIHERDCALIRLEWRIGTPDHYDVVDVVFLEPAKARGEGRFRFGPWRLHASIDQLRDRSFARAVHRCHPFWETETLFYGGA